MVLDISFFIIPKNTLLLLCCEMCLQATSVVGCAAVKKTKRNLQQKHFNETHTNSC
jgi:hypothetical protein